MDKAINNGEYGIQPHEQILKKNNNNNPEMIAWISLMQNKETEITIRLFHTNSYIKCIKKMQ